jgi:membrane-associated phospholipid phosphatase
MRGIGLTEVLSALPGLLVVAFAVVTQLGDVWFLLALTGSAYWLGSATPRVGLSRERAAVALAALLLAYAVVSTLKPLVGLPRPPGAARPPQLDLVPPAARGFYAWLSTGDGFGFPSGHAIGAAAVYGGLAWAVRTGSRRTRVALAAAMVALVSLSRLVLGLHYLVDVLAGAGLGALAVGVAVWLGRPRRTLALASAVAVVGLALTGVGHELASVAGLCVGALLGVGLAEGGLSGPSGRESVAATVAVGALVAGPLLAASAELSPGPASAAVLGVLGGTALTAAPLAGRYLGR